MKKIHILIALGFMAFSSRSQSVLADFESFGLPANSAYSSTASISFSTTNAIFTHKYDTQFSYWAGGFAYTNKYDSSTAGSGNLYGVKAKYGYNSSATYVVGQDKGIIKLKAPSNSVDGFYMTNTTYAYKSMKNGDMFAKKFGGVSGNDPDYLKVTVKGYLNGTMKTDSSVFYLANFTFTNNAQDYLVGSWQYVNTSNLGQVDSIKFFMYSSDNSGGFMNTPAFFAIDNFSTSQIVGLQENSAFQELMLYPNPFENSIQLKMEGLDNKKMQVMLSDIYGKKIAEWNNAEREFDLSDLSPGIYFFEISEGNNKITKKIIKN